MYESEIQIGDVMTSVVIETIGGEEDAAEDSEGDDTDDGVEDPDTTVTNENTEDQE